MGVGVAGWDVPDDEHQVEGEPLFRFGLDQIREHQIEGEPLFAE